MDDDNGNPAPAAELAPNRNVQRSPAPPSQALAKLHPADGEAAFARVEQSIEQLPSTVKALELRDGLRACPSGSGELLIEWVRGALPVGRSLLATYIKLQVFSASAVAAFGPWSLDSRVDVCGSPRGFRHRTEAVVHRALLSRRAQAEFDGYCGYRGPPTNAILTRVRVSGVFGGLGFVATSALFSADRALSCAFGPMLAVIDPAGGSHADEARGGVPAVGDRQGLRLVG